MLVFETVIGFLIGGAALAALSKRLAIPYPALVALAGAALALVPGTPTLVLDPELALTLFVAPVLLDAAFDSSLRDLRKNWRSVAGLALGAVLVTVAAVAVVAKLMVPAMSWSVAVALGAIVAPPDAAAATAVLKQLQPPQRLLVILEGESLFNDASALLVYRIAVGAAFAHGGLSAGTVVPSLFAVTIGSVVLGLVLSRVTLAILRRSDDVAIVTVIQFCTAFGVWMLAERLHLSGILTMVVFAMASARRAAGLIPARVRIPSFAVWEVAVFVLNVLAFILVGFQLKAIIGRIDARTLVGYALVAAAVGGAAIVARIAWVYASLFIGLRARDVAPSPRNAAVVAWCGMRGIVTLATALALPNGDDGTAPFPHRDLILFTAFAVVLGTLVVQGMTLRPLMRVLRIVDDGSVEREVRLGRAEVLRAGLAVLAVAEGDELAAVHRQRMALTLRRTDAAEANEAQRALAQRDANALHAALAAERRRLVTLRAEGTIGDPAFQRLEQDLDVEELHLTQLTDDARAFLS